MKFSSSILGGLAGALAVTIIHESIRRVYSKAPRMDKLGMEGIEKVLDKVDVDVPEEDTLFNITLFGDIISNTIYYSLAGCAGKTNVIAAASALGVLAGFGGVYLPKPMGLNPAKSARTPETKLLTVCYYSIGGLVAGVAMNAIEDRN